MANAVSAFVVRSRFLIASNGPNSIEIVRNRLSLEIGVDVGDDPRAVQFGYLKGFGFSHPNCLGVCCSVFAILQHLHGCSCSVRVELHALNLKLYMDRLCVFKPQLETLILRSDVRPNLPKGVDVSLLERSNVELHRCPNGIVAITSR